MQVSDDERRVFEVVQISARGGLVLLFSMALVAATAASLMVPTLQEGSVLRCYEIFEPPVVTRAIPGEVR